MVDALWKLGLVEAVEKLKSGEISPLDLVEASAGRIEAVDDALNAMPTRCIDRARDHARRIMSGAAPGGLLGGVPVGIKDIIDVKGIPTGNGLMPGGAAKPQRDAFVVERLKAAGAIIMGKTVTTELAFMHPSKTRNPRNLEHTPGGSSAGSAAAVADGMVPLAIGTQTGGSVIRPASFCGVTGFKPTFGAIPRRGVLAQSPSLDTLGVFATDPIGAAILAEVLYGHDAEDAETALAPHPRLYETAGSALGYGGVHRRSAVPSVPDG